MTSVIKVEAEGKTRVFRGKDDIDVQYKLDDWVDYKVQTLRPKERGGEYLKISCAYGDEKKPLEVEFYEHLKGSGLAPELLRYGDFFSFRTTYEESGLVLDKKYSFFAIERFGASLEEVYGSSPRCMNSSEKMRSNDKMFDDTFPPGKFPEEVRESIKELIECLSEEGIDHEDFHAGNILTDGYVLKAIDFECASFTTNIY
ncbi:putative serine/threonine protein kinase [Brazilian marseillevirus]|uniref:putative serine/threonine protein kinase n=1 Tax=Brazilian marseillevirus TaxID=1813599 RepID=UPI00078111DF|nr:putative serine/threonine protein kinase [Brazilian marseillevirus]AMQ10918.1 putative serine/threonine protein kinase [Brazilian marseillevirus]